MHKKVNLEGPNSIFPDRVGKWSEVPINWWLHETKYGMAVKWKKKLMRKRNEAMIYPTTKMGFEYFCWVTKADNKRGHVLSFIRKVQNKQIYRERNWLSNCLEQR